MNTLDRESESMLLVLSTRRAVRDTLNRFSLDGILPSCMSVGDFFSRAVLCANTRQINEGLRALLLEEASKMCSASKLGLPEEFFGFLKNSSYVFGLLSECECAYLDPELLRELDFYDEYKEHISILGCLLKSYKKLCEQRGLFDTITLPGTFVINKPFISSFKKIDFFLDGLPSAYECRVLSEVSALTALRLHIEIDSFCQKQVAILKDMGFELENGFAYELDMGTREIISSRVLCGFAPVDLFSFSNRLSQAGWIKSKIIEWVTKKGYDPSRIAVVLPDEKFAKILADFDMERNFNFSTGISFEGSDFVVAIKSIESLALRGRAIDKSRIEKLCLDSCFVNDILGRWNEPFSAQAVCEALEPMLAKCTDDAQKDAALDVFYDFQTEFVDVTSATFGQLYGILCESLCAKKLDDVCGGAVTVMGVLETRSMEFDAVIIADCNDGIVPSSSVKDMILSDTIKKEASIPTSFDRENLQKHYYAKLLRNCTKEVAISFVQDEQSIPSHILSQFGFDTGKAFRLDCDEALFSIRKPKTRLLPNVPMDVSVDLASKPLSASKLKDYLECKYRFWLKYEQKIKDANQISDIPSPADIGSFLHAALKNVFYPNAKYKSLQRLKDSLSDALSQSAAKDPYWQFTVQLWLQRMDEFCKNEFDRLQSGYKPLHCEINLATVLNGVSLEGRVDRIDEKNGSLYVLDYKSATVIQKPSFESLDFQLPIYRVLASSIGGFNDIFAQWYELKSGKLYDEPQSAQSDEGLFTILEEYKKDVQSFERTDKRQRCRYCAYVEICGIE